MQLRADQQRVLQMPLRPGRLHRVLGRPGTGKSTVAVELVAQQLRAGALTADQVVAIAASRPAATDLRAAIARRVGGVHRSVLAHTMPAFSFAMLRSAAAAGGEPIPTLLTGAEQDAILAQLLAGHAQGYAAAPDWPTYLLPALATRGFRRELRDLLMRAVEYDVSPEQLADLGRKHAESAWVAAAQLQHEYDQVTALSAPGGFDPAWVVAAAANLLQHGDDSALEIRERLALIVVDDAQELTSPAARLLRLLAADGGPALVVFGDPDVASQTFRGADPRLLHDLGGVPCAAPEPIILRYDHRLPPQLARAASRVAARIGTSGASQHRGAQTLPTSEGTLEVHLLRGAAQEGTLIAEYLRRAHLLDEVAWHELVVIVRGGQRTATLRRILQRHGVPVTAHRSQVPLRDENSVAPLLTLLRMTGAVVFDQALPLIEDIEAVLASPLVGADAIAIRQARRALRSEALAIDAPAPSDELLRAAVLDPERLAHLGAALHPIRQVALMLAAGVQAATKEPPENSAEAVLWALWDAAGVASKWQASAIAGGVAGSHADQRLDAVMAAFEVAARFADRLPGARLAQFVEHLSNLEVEADTLAPRALLAGHVEILTPAAAAGRQWRRVVIAGVQEGVWPDLRLRGSLLGADRLVEVVTGVSADTGDGSKQQLARAGLRARQQAVLHDETRLFYLALTRAQEKVLVTAVSNVEEQPSTFLDLVDPPDGPRQSTDVAGAWDLTTLVGQLRRTLAEDAATAPATAEATGALAVAGVAGQLVATNVGDAIAALALLSQAGVPGSHPEQWWALRAARDERPLRPAGALVPVSPSSIDTFTSCGLRWLLTSRGGQRPGQGTAQIGTLIHEIAALENTSGDHAPADLTLEEMLAQLEQRWPRLGLAPGWVEQARRVAAGDMLRRLTSQFAAAQTAGWQRCATEVDIDLTIGRGRLRGRIDRLEADPSGLLRIIDIKTGSSKPTKAQLEHHAQLGAYQLALEHDAILGQPSAGNGGAALLQIGAVAAAQGNLQVQPPLAEADDPLWAQQLVTDSAEGMAQPRVQARHQDASCRRCPVRACCPLQPEGARLT